MSPRRSKQALQSRAFVGFRQRISMLALGAGTILALMFLMPRQSGPALPSVRVDVQPVQPDGFQPLSAPESALQAEWAAAAAAAANKTGLAIRSPEKIHLQHTIVDLEQRLARPETVPGFSRQAYERRLQTAQAALQALENSTQ